MNETARSVRFRHTARFVLWRPDRDPRSFTFSQIAEPARFDLYDVIQTASRSG